MARRERRVSVGMNLSFLDVMSCGFGAAVLLFLIANHSVARGAGLAELDAQTDNARSAALLREAEKQEQRLARTRARSAALSDLLGRARSELARLQREGAAKRERIAQHQQAIGALEKQKQQSAGRLEQDGRNLRDIEGEGQRQYLSGLEVRGDRIAIWLDASASMLGERLIDVLRRRNMSRPLKLGAEKWQRALRTTEWLASQMPEQSRYQIYTFNTRARPALPGTAGKWLRADNAEELDRVFQALRNTVPEGGTSLERAFLELRKLQPPPDSLMLIVDSLPTQGARPPRGATVSSERRMKHFERALTKLPDNLPVHVILFPMEGDPLAASAYWQLALASRGSLISPSKDWP